eukprot:TRINITY_DN15935_c0_g1_i1.p4 TRINITY_DN15935_c0_g1~~TRINITY_DN15935_c0_g1_i1.p4  ORF type:complete len:107 (+),score=40.28 TRINITY_DN15935_c0_g1_i1:94-414(+)
MSGGGAMGLAHGTRGTNDWMGEHDNASSFLPVGGRLQEQPPQPPRVDWLLQNDNATSFLFTRNSPQADEEGHAAAPTTSSPPVVAQETSVPRLRAIDLKMMNDMDF